MTVPPPFVDQETGRIDRNQILVEAIPLAELVGVIAAVALVPFAFVVLLGDRSGLGAIFMLATQFILTVGAGIVLIYSIARAIQLTNE